MKKKILTVALGYPTKENPYEGSFFKEQIDFLSEEYDFTVLVYREDRKGILFGRKTSYTELEYTKGIKQYYPVVHISLLRRLSEVIGSIIRKKKSNKTAVGIYRSESYCKYRKKVIAQIIKDLNLDGDLVYCISAQGSAFEALQFSEIMNKPFVISEHRPFPHPGWATIETEKEAFEKADCFFAIGKDKIRQVMLQDIKLKKIVYTGNLIDEEKFIMDPQKHEYPTILIVAANSYFKNFDMFVETLNRVTERTDREFRVIVAGYGANKGYGDGASPLEEKIRASRFFEKTELIPEVSRDEICSLYNRADVFVLTSIQEGQPMVALEAACCGLPVFSTRCGGVEDYITDRSGRIVDITDSYTLADNLVDFIEGKIQFNKTEIRDNVVGKYGRKVFMDTVKSEFDGLIEK